MFAAGHRPHLEVQPLRQVRWIALVGPFVFAVWSPFQGQSSTAITSTGSILRGSLGDFTTRSATSITFL